MVEENSTNNQKKYFSDRNIRLASWLYVGLLGIIFLLAVANIIPFWYWQYL